MLKESHKTIYDLIASMDPFDDVENQHIAFATNWIKHTDQIFRIEKPATPPIHLVSYFVLIDQKTNQILLTDHKKANLWLPPGGHVELDEHPMQTVKREAQEELGIEANFLLDYPFFLTITQTVGAFQHIDVSLWYLLKGDCSIHLSYDHGEFNQIRWFASEEVPFIASDPHMRRFIDKLNKFLTLNSYEDNAVEYARNTELLHSEREAKKFIDMLPEHAHVLDIGCGPGRDAKIFADQGLKVVGVDFSAKMINLARQMATRAEFHIMDIEKLEFPKSAFDGIWASASFLHISKKNIPQIFKNIHELLKPEGIFYLSVKKGSGEMLQSDARYGNAQKFWSFFEEQEIITQLKEADFEIVENAITEKKSSYHTHPMIYVFCKKMRQT